MEQYIESGRSGPIADRAKDLTPALLSAALSRPEAPVRVTEVRTERVGTGQMGSTHRLQLSYGPGGGGPATLIAKLAADDPLTRTLIADGYRKEVGFYAELASDLTVRTPRCWYGAIAEDRLTFTLLLDDLEPARPGRQVDGCGLEAAVAAVRNLAGLHAPRWNDDTLDEHDFLEHLEADAAAFIGALHVAATGLFLERYKGRLGPDDCSTLQESAVATGVWLRQRPRPFAVTHGDYRLDNLMFHPDGDVIALDWQTVSIAPPARDLAYFLGTSLDTTLRRQHEHDLVEEYCRAVAELGVTGYGAERCFEDYRLGQLQAPLITVLGCEYASAQRTPDADEMFLAMATRSCAAIRDLHSLDLVD